MPSQKKPKPVNGKQMESVPVDSLVMDPANARQHGPRNLDAIKASLLRFGQQKPIVVDGTGVVVAGNGTLAAARDLGWPDIKVVRTALVGAEAVAFAIADNRTAELAEWDKDGLAQQLTALQNDLDFDHMATGFTEDEIDAMTAGIVKPDYQVDSQPGGVDAEAEWAGMPEFTSKDKTSLQRIIVHFATREDVEAFAELIGQKLTDKTRSIWYPKAAAVVNADKVYINAT